MAHSHRPDGGPCKFRTVKECNDAYADMQARTWVDLATRVIERKGVRAYKDNNLFSQLVRVMAGEQSELMDAKGKNPATGSWATQLRKVMEGRNATA